MNLVTLSLLCIALLIIEKSQLMLVAFQKNIYNENGKYFTWVKENKKLILSSLESLSIGLFIVAFFLSNEISVFFIVLGDIGCFLEMLRIASIFKGMEAKKLILTKKIKRLIVTTSIWYLIPVLIYLTNYDNGYFWLTVETIFSYFNYFIIWVSYKMNRPIEAAIDRYEWQKAQVKLESIKDLKVIGITGTYGKTSTKYILEEVLKKKYVCQSTPKNVNTLHGLVSSINSYLDAKEEVFIAEMGAYKPRIIENLCDFIHPQFAILTTIEVNNISSFGNKDNTVNTLFELIESLPKTGVAILNKDDWEQKEYQGKIECQKIWVSLEQDADYVAKEIEYNREGSSFLVYEKDTNKEYKVKTKLLGKHNIYHILSVIALARILGLELDEILPTIENLRPLENHLDMHDYGYMYQINNTHRSNPLGAKDALDVLERMPGVKIVVTTGMQNLGEKTGELNNIFGTQMAKVANYVILINEKSTKSVFQGLMESGFEKDKIYIVNNVADAYTLLQQLETKKKIYVLFESDDDLKY